MFSDPKPNEIKDWVCVYESNLEYEVQLVKNYLSDQRIPSNILSKRDTAYSLNVGEMALVYLYVPEHFEKKARKAIEEIQNDENGNIGEISDE